MGTYSNPFDTRNERLKQLREHRVCAHDEQLSPAARDWHAGMYVKLGGRADAACLAVTR